MLKRHYNCGLFSAHWEEVCSVSVLPQEVREPSHVPLRDELARGTVSHNLRLTNSRRGGQDRLLRIARRYRRIYWRSRR
jgi:hypothetical protein